MKQVIVGLDPGLTTGYAIIDEESGEVLEAGSIREEDLDDSILASLGEMRPQFSISKVVIESFPSNAHKRLQDIYHKLLRYFDCDYRPVHPGTYLPVMKSRHIQMPLRFDGEIWPHTIHAIEAAKLAIYYWVFLRKKDR